MLSDSCRTLPKAFDFIFFTSDEWRFFDFPQKQLNILKLKRRFGPVLHDEFWDLCFFMQIVQKICLQARQIIEFLSFLHLRQMPLEFFILKETLSLE